jgi:hypothetical protein
LVDANLVVEAMTEDLQPAGPSSAPIQRPQRLVLRASNGQASSSAAAAAPKDKNAKGKQAKGKAKRKVDDTDDEDSESLTSSVDSTESEQEAPIEASKRGHKKNKSTQQQANASPSTTTAPGNATANATPTGFPTEPAIREWPSDTMGQAMYLGSHAGWVNRVDEHMADVVRKIDDVEESWNITRDLVRSWRLYWINQGNARGH